MTNNKTRQWIRSFSLSILFLLLACNANEQQSAPADNTNVEDSLSRLLEKERSKVDSLIKERAEEVYPILFGREFKEIKNPEQYITEHLRGKRELIPLDPVLGGTMAFRKIDVLSEKWVMGIYDDGHIQGQAIYEYRLLPNDSLEFSLLVFDNPGQQEADGS